MSFFGGRQIRWEREVFGETESVGAGRIASC